MSLLGFESVHNQTFLFHSNTMLGADAIGDSSWIAPSACLRDGIDIGEGVTIGMGAVVTKDVPDDMTVMGVPALPIDEEKLLLKRLSDLVRDG